MARKNCLKLDKAIMKRVADVILGFSVTGKIHLEFLGMGASRTTYALDDRYVLKFDHSSPRGSPGYYNLSEYRNFKIAPKNKAKCRIWKADPRFLIMERLPRIGSDVLRKDKQGVHIKPRWLRFACKFDGNQFGRTREGKIVMYDYQDYWGQSFLKETSEDNFDAETAE